jgi:hypothetical protein
MTETARLIGLHDTLKPHVERLAGRASSLLEHYHVKDHFLLPEIKMRLDELEEHLRFLPVLMETLADVGVNSNVWKLVEKMVAKSRGN